MNRSSCLMSLLSLFLFSLGATAFAQGPKDGNDFNPFQRLNLRVWKQIYSEVKEARRAELERDLIALKQKNPRSIPPLEKIKESGKKPEGDHPLSPELNSAIAKIVKKINQEKGSLQERDGLLRELKNAMDSTLKRNRVHAENSPQYKELGDAPRRSKLHPGSQVARSEFGRVVKVMDYPINLDPAPAPHESAKIRDDGTAALAAAIRIDPPNY